MSKKRFGFTLIGLVLMVLLLSPSAQAGQRIAFGIYGGGEAGNQGQTIEQVVKGGETAFVQFHPGSPLSFCDCPPELSTVQEGVFETALSGVYHFGTMVAFSVIPEHTTAVLGLHVDADVILLSILENQEPGEPNSQSHSALILALQRSDQRSTVGVTVFCKGEGPCIIDISKSHFSGHLLYKK